MDNHKYQVNTMQKDFQEDRQKLIDDLSEQLKGFYMEIINANKRAEKAMHEKDLIVR